MISHFKLVLSCGFTSALSLSGAAQSDEILTELQQLRAQHNELAARISQIENQLGLEQASAQDRSVIRLAAPLQANSTGMPSQLSLGGDIRFRSEINRSNGLTPNRDRGVVRARLEGRYSIDPTWALSGRVVTGALDDPNTTDVTLGQFGDDLEIGLDLLYAERSFPSGRFLIGKHPNLFATTDMVWDGDVSLQGLAGEWMPSLAPHLNIGLRGAFFVIEESEARQDSFMLGAQVFTSLHPTMRSNATFALSHYNFDLDAIDSADLGDFRTNRRTLSGAYASKFQITDVFGQLSMPTRSKDWLLRVTAQAAYNSGASAWDSFAYTTGLALGDLASGGKKEISYWYSKVEQDAILTAFSHDNIPLASGYELHNANTTLRISDQIQLDGSLFLYRDRRSLPSEQRLDQGNWQLRGRANLSFRF